MRGDRITSEAAHGGRRARTGLVAVRDAACDTRGVEGLGRWRVALALALSGIAGSLLPAAAADRGTIPGGPAPVVMAAAEPDPAPDGGGPGPAAPAPAPPGSTAADPAAGAGGGAVRRDSAGSGAGPLGSAVGVLEAPRAAGRGRRRRGREPMPGCTATATLDGVSAALQAGPFGRGRGLAIMQFRNVVTEGTEDGRVACRSDVLLSDGSMHHAEYELHRAGRGTRLRIEVARERADTAPAGVDAPAQGGPVPLPLVPSDPGPPASVPPQGAPGPALPAT